MSTAKLGRPEDASSFKNRKVLVTGGAGFIGSHLVQSLNEAGAEVHVLDNLSHPVESSLRLLEPLATKLMVKDQAEVFEHPDTLDLSSFDYLFHLASLSTVYDSVARPFDDFSSNYRSTFLLLERLRNLKRKPKLIYASSAAVYGNGNAILKEDDSYQPISPYGVSKLAGERMVSVYAGIYEVPAVSLRLFPVYGPRQRKQVVYDLIKRLHNDSSELVVRAPSTYGRDFTFVTDIVAAFRLAALKIPGDGKAYNASSGKFVTLQELVNAIVAATGFTPRVHFDTNAQKSDAFSMQADISKISTFGFRPSVGLSEGIQRTVDWYRDAMGAIPFRKTG